MPGRWRRWRGEKLAWHAELVWLADELLDWLPAWQDGRLIHGQWGCRLGLHRYYWREEFRRP